MADREYDIVLFGVTGFTGKLACEHLLSKAYPIRWAVCARSEAKARSVLTSIATRLGISEDALPPVLVADLQPPVLPLLLQQRLAARGDNDVLAAEETKLAAEENKLREVVRKTTVVITAAGPFEKYGKELVRICAEEGTHYADTTGESDFFRNTIDLHDATAQRTGAKIVSHCGNDCIPWDLAVLAAHELALAKRGPGSVISAASTFTELPAGVGASGGTLSTAIYQLGKKRGGGAKPSFDPLLKLPDGSKSKRTTKVKSPKSDVWYEEFQLNGGPWIMAPVMGNCVRRSCALLGYAGEGGEFEYAEAQLRDLSWSRWVADASYNALIGAAIYVQPLRALLPSPGEGPTREDMEAGFLKLHLRATGAGADGKEFKVKGLMTFDEDTGYLCTGRMLAESGMELLEAAKKGGEKVGGVLTPATAMGTSLLRRMERELPMKWEVEIVD